MVVFSFASDSIRRSFSARPVAVAPNVGKTTPALKLRPRSALSYGAVLLSCAELILMSITQSNSVS